jgi:hypothetical protein
MMPLAQDRRLEPERRSSRDRRVDDVSVPIDRRTRERRAGPDRRLELDSATGQLHAALGLLTRAVEAGTLSDDERRLLDSAMLRLRFALDTLETELPP